MKTNREFQSFGEYLQAVASAESYGPDPRLVSAAAGLGESIGSTGGFCVPEDFASRLLSKTYATGEILRRCVDLGAPSGNTIIVPTIDESSRKEGSRFGGMRSYWLEEGGTITATKPAFGMQKRILNKLIGLAYVTNEWIDDLPDSIGNAIETVASMELAYRFENAIVRGTGAGTPLGLLHAGCKITVDAVASQTAGTVWGQNILDMLARLWGPSQRTAVWLYNQELLPTLSKLAVEADIDAATSGVVDGRLWNWGAAGSWPTLAGLPAIPCEHCSEPGAEGDLILCDLSQYAVTAKEPAMQTIDVRFLQDESCFRFRLRCDGAPTWASALTPDNGTATLSPIVTLADRVDEE